MIGVKIMHDEKMMDITPALTPLLATKANDCSITKSVAIYANALATVDSTRCFTMAGRCSPPVVRAESLSLLEAKYIDVFRLKNSAVGSWFLYLQYL